MRAPRVAVVAFQGVSPFHLSVPATVFGEDRSKDGFPKIDFRLCAEKPGTVSTSVGFPICVALPLSALKGADLVIIPGWPSDLPNSSPALKRALKGASRRGSVIVGLCLGTFVLAEAGLLAGRKAATHWLKTKELSVRYPSVNVDQDVLYVDEGNVVTSAGSAAALDCCLHLYRKLFGAELANRLARRLVCSPHRQGGQAQFIESPVPKTLENDVFSRALEWASRNLDTPLDLDTLADQAHLSRRHFTRRFRQTMGTSPGEWLLGQKLAHSQRLLEGTRLSIERVAQESGFGSAVTFRQRFNQAFKTSPIGYRREFGKTRKTKRCRPKYNTLRLIR